MRLLVVEDEPALCQSIAEGLRLDGYEVDTCGDGQEALELCCVERFALILLDLSLPGLDGMELLRHLRAEDAETPVLILSARGQLQDKVDGLDAGANDYLTKPFHFEELEARVRSLTRRKFVQGQTMLQLGRAFLAMAALATTLCSSHRAAVPSRSVLAASTLLA